MGRIDTTMHFIIVRQHHAAAERQVRYPRLRIMRQENARRDIGRGILLPPGYSGQIIQPPGLQISRDRHLFYVIIGMGRQGFKYFLPAPVQAFISRVHKLSHAAETPVDVGDYREAASLDFPEQDRPIALFLCTRNHCGKFEAGVHFPVDQVNVVPGYQRLNV